MVKKTTHLLCPLVIFNLLSIIAFSQIDYKTLHKERSVSISYFQNEDYLVILFDSKYTPFIYTDVTRNNQTDPYVDKLYTVGKGSSLCVAIQLEDNSTCLCGQSSGAILFVENTKYQFIIPKIELSYNLLQPINLSFGLFDVSTNKVYSIRNNQESFVIIP